MYVHLTVSELKDFLSVVIIFFFLLENEHGRFYQMKVYH